MTCKVCQYKSVHFDPFTFLSLPLPMESTVNLEVVGKWEGKWVELLLVGGEVGGAIACYSK